MVLFPDVEVGYPLLVATGGLHSGLGSPGSQLGSRGQPDAVSLKVMIFEKGRRVAMSRLSSSRRMTLTHSVASTLCITRRVCSQPQ